VASKYQRYDEQGLGLYAGKGFGGLDRPAFPGEIDLEPNKYRFMKTRTSRMCLFASLGAASLVALSATAQTPAPATTTTPPPSPTVSAPVTLPYGVEDVLKLSRAQVSEDVMLTFIHNSGTIYNLAPKDIVYLHNEGVSDRVITAMLDQRKNVPAEMAARTAPPSAPAPVYPDANAAAAAQAAAHQAAAQNAAASALPAPAYLPPEPTYAPASTVYDIPYASPDYYPYYYGGYPYYYGGYPYYYGPSVAFGFGFGYGGRFGYGGYRGGGFHGGGFHGGGFGGGGHGGGGHR
jgi:hypothetical protein